MILWAFVFIIGASMQEIADLGVFYAGRLISGLAIGATSMVRSCPISSTQRYQRLILASSLHPNTSARMHQSPSAAVSQPSTTS